MNSTVTSVIASKGISGAALRKLVGRASRRTAHVAADRFFNYVVNDGTLEAEYLLRGDEGTYREVWGGTDPLHGDLTFISEEPIVIQEQSFNGARYSAIDEAGEWLYFFGADDLTGAGGFLVAIFVGDFNEGSLLYATLASRTDA